MIHKKAILKQLVAGVVSLGLLLLPVAEPAIANVNASPAVVSNANQILANSLNQLKANPNSASAWASGAAALQILFAYWNEQGLTAKVQNRILSNSTAFINNPILTQSQMDSACAEMKTTLGITDSCAEAASAMNADKARRRQIVQEIQSVGVAGIEAEILKHWQDEAASARLKGPASFRSASLQIRPKLRLVVSGCARCTIFATVTALINPLTGGIVEIFCLLFANC